MSEIKSDFSKLKALYVNCTLKKSPRQIHTQTQIDVFMNIMEKEGVDAKCIRLYDGTRWNFENPEYI